MTVLYTSATVLTAVSLTPGDCVPTQKHLSSCCDLFADNAALVAYTERALQHITPCFAEAAQLFEL